MSEAKVDGLYGMALICLDGIRERAEAGDYLGAAIHARVVDASFAYLAWERIHHEEQVQAALARAGEERPQ